MNPFRFSSLARSIRWESCRVSPQRWHSMDPSLRSGWQRWV